MLIKEEEFGFTQGTLSRKLKLKNHTKSRRVSDQIFTNISMQEKVRRGMQKSGNFPTSPNCGTPMKNSDLEDVIVGFKKKASPSPQRGSSSIFGSTACWTPKI